MQNGIAKQKSLSLRCVLGTLRCVILTILGIIRLQFLLLNPRLLAMAIKKFRNSLLCLKYLSIPLSNIYIFGEAHKQTDNHQTLLHVLQSTSGKHVFACVWQSTLVCINRKFKRKCHILLMLLNTSFVQALNMAKSIEYLV